MDIKVGDRVKFRTTGKEGTVRSISGPFVEVVHDGEFYYWQKSGVELIDNQQDFDFDAFISEYHTHNSSREVKRCTCSNWELFHFGCKCGSFKQEQEKRDELQRERERGDLDRKDKE